MTHGQAAGVSCFKFATVLQLQHMSRDLLPTESLLGFLDCISKRSSHLWDPSITWNSNGHLKSQSGTISKLDPNYSRDRQMGKG